MAAQPGLEVLAHGGLVGLIAETAVVLVVASIFLAVWLRERRSGGERPAGAARLREDDEAPP
jgi:hypothetical protein